MSQTESPESPELGSNPLLKRFAAARAASSSDPYRPIYHFGAPDGGLNDPNGLCFWRGRWHLFYQSHEAGTQALHWGHAVSEDLVHWRDLPYALYPDLGSPASGTTVVEDDRVTALYPAIGAGQAIARSSDELLLTWANELTDISKVSDSAIWVEDGRYFGVVGNISWPVGPGRGVEITHQYLALSDVPRKHLGTFDDAYGIGVWPALTLWTSTDGTTWEEVGELLDPNPFTDRFDEMACPNLVRIADKHILLFFSHINGGQYLLGDYDPDRRRFVPYEHGRLNHGQVGPGGIHAPSAAVDGRGGVINICNFNEGSDGFLADRFMTLPQRLTLGDDERLRIAPVDSLATLRRSHRHVRNLQIPTGREVVLEQISGNAIELIAEIDPRHCHWVQLNVLRSPDAEEVTSITFYNLHGPEGLYLDGRLSEEVVLDVSRSTTRQDIRIRPPERAKVDRQGDRLRLHVFIDRSTIEVFVNERQYLGCRVYPGREDSRGVSLSVHGGDAVLTQLDAWQLNGIWRN